jgi:glyoxylase-like metal-dependent hydrolase (beta-lactamase superfamily II)
MDDVLQRARGMRNTEICARGVYRLRTLMANVYFVEDGTGNWTLIDAGLPGFASSIRATAESLFHRPPSAIVLTHGHFDHVGGLRTLADSWGVPVYAHPLEMPYITGRSSYPPPDPTVGGGAWSALSVTFPRGPIDIGHAARMLPAGGVVPTLLDWRWIHTPGHTPGHVSLFRDTDRTLIAGDAIVTTRQESFTDVLAQREEVWRPPAYYTSDWRSARESVRLLESLRPSVLATGHGVPLSGPAMREGLARLASDFDEIRPRHGRYVRQPALADGDGVLYVPPPPPSSRAAVIAGASALGAAALLVALSRSRARRHRHAGPVPKLGET